MLMNEFIFGPPTLSKRGGEGGAERHLKGNFINTKINKYYNYLKRIKKKKEIYKRALKALYYVFIKSF